MYKIKYTKKSILGLKKFINSYKNSFIKLINNSWLEVESTLIKNYIEIWDKLYSWIIDKIRLVLADDNVLWKYIRENNKKYVIISVNSFKLFIYYKENISMKERYIEDIEIFRK